MSIFIALVISLSTPAWAEPPVQVPAPLQSEKPVPAAADPPANWNYVEKRLVKAGFMADFITALRENYDPKNFKDVVELNVLLFLRKTNIHAPQVSDVAVERVRKFIEQNHDSLMDAEAKENVPGPVIASLLWMESRYGENLGKYSVPSVFADLVQADRPEIIKDLRKRGAFRFSKHPKARDLRKIAARAAKKSKWAIGELKDLEKIYHARGDNSVFELRGSYAGAFGMSQFLPSSYRRMTVKSPTLRALNLDHADDAIRSVAIYLHDNGWREKITRTHVKALMNYNDSRDYADSILKLAADVAGVKTQASDRRHIPRTKKQRDIANEH